jgi:hypothetical protein
MESQKVPWVCPNCKTENEYEVGTNLSMTSEQRKTAVCKKCGINRFSTEYYENF